MPSHDPFRARRRPVVDTSVLPDRRLRRLGVTERTLAWLASLWSAMPPGERDEAARDIAVLPDPGVVALLVAGVPPDGTADDQAAWAASQDDPASAALWALQVEQAQPEPRADVLAVLSRMGGL